MRLNFVKKTTMPLLSFSSYLNILSCLFGQVEKGLIRKIRLFLKFMTSQLGKQTIATCILPNISRSKNNQAMKFGQLMEYNTRNIFLEKSYTKCSGETTPRPFSTKSKLNISLDLQFKVLCSLFLLHA